MTTSVVPRAVPPALVPVVHDRRARFDAAVRLGAGAALWLSLLAVAYWWATGGGVQDLAGWRDGLTSLGRLTGLAASDLLLAQVLLMARVPVLERAFGQDELVRLHRLVGFTSFNLMVAHIVLITWGYAAGELGRTPATFWDLVTGYPGMLLALAGTACLVMTVVTSVRAARARLRYESWHLLHLYAYLGVGLALPHQLWTGQEFLASAAATVYWWSLWALAAGAVLVWRVGLPVWRNARHRLRVAAVVPEAAGVASVHITGRRLDRLPAQAGQFLTWRFLGGQGWTRGNPYSLSAAPDGRALRITVKELGDNSAQVPRLRPGTPVLFEGPFGRLTARAPGPPQGGPDRRRGRCGPSAGPGRGAGLRVRRRRPAAPVHRPAAVRARAAPARGRSGPGDPVAARPPAGARLLAGRRHRHRRRRHRPRLVGARPGRAGRLCLRSRGVGRERAPRDPGRRPARRPAPCREVQVVTC